MRYLVDDLGVQAYGDQWMSPGYGRNPLNGHEVALLPLGVGGFVVADPLDRTSIHVRPGVYMPNGSWDAVAQAPDGRIYLTGVFCKNVPLFVWNWEGRQADVVAELPGMSFFSMDLAPNGCVYLPEYGQNTLIRFNPDRKQVESCAKFHAFCTNIRNVFCGTDGWVYLMGIDYSKGEKFLVIAYNPDSNRSIAVAAPPESTTASPVAWGSLAKDADGRVLVAQSRWGRTHWLELRCGALHDTEQAAIRLTPDNRPLAFRDGSYIVTV